MRHAIDFPFPNEAAPDRFVDRLLQLAPVHMPRPQQIDDRSQRTRDAHAVYFLDVARVEVRPVQDENFRNLARPAESRRAGRFPGARESSFRRSRGRSASSPRTPPGWLALS